MEKHKCGNCENMIDKKYINCYKCFRVKNNNLKTCIICNKIIQMNKICFNCNINNKRELMKESIKNKLIKVNLKDYFLIFDDFIDDIEKTHNNSLISKAVLLKDYLMMITIP